MIILPVGANDEQKTITLLNCGAPEYSQSHRHGPPPSVEHRILRPVSGSTQLDPARHDTPKQFACVVTEHLPLPEQHLPNSSGGGGSGQSGHGGQSSLSMSVHVPLHCASVVNE